MVFVFVGYAVNVCWFGLRFIQYAEDKRTLVNEVRHGRKTNIAVTAMPKSPVIYDRTKGNTKLVFVLFFLD